MTAFIEASMLHHVLLCLDEIEAEVASDGLQPLAAETRERMQAHVGAMRALLKLPAAAVDDLTLIRGIDARVARHLAVRGVTSFAAIAGWTAADVAAMTGEMIAARRISHEGWIEQAAVLARGDTTHHSRRVAQGELACLVALTPTAAAPAPVVEAPASIALPPPLPVQATATQLTPPPLPLPPRYLPPLLDGKGLRPLPTEWIMLDRPVLEPVAAVTEIEPEMAIEATAQAEPAISSEPCEFVPVPTAAVIAARREALVRWGRRTSLAAALALLASIGLAGIEAKFAGSNAQQVFTSLVSAD